VDNFFLSKKLPRVRDVYRSGALEVFKKFRVWKKCLAYASRACAGAGGRVPRVCDACV